MRAYDTYKDSGISWLGQIPSHWDVKRTRIVLAENTTVNSDASITTQLQFKYGEIEPKANQTIDDGVRETISKYTVADEGDIMINGLNLNYDFISQRVGQVKEKGCITSAYISLRPTELADSRYYTYFLKAMDNIKMFHGMGSGVRLTLSYKELKNMFIPIPPIGEQRAMADYIDSVTAEIDQAIASQQHMVERLQERKQIIINEAVTRGINPDAPMKQTSINWLPDIPAHWDLRRLKYVSYDYKAGPFGSSLITSELNSEGNILVYTPEHIANQSTDIEGNLYLPESRKNEMSQFFIKPGDIIFPIVGSLGREMIIQEGMPNGIINQRLAKFAINPDYLDTNYFMWLFAYSTVYDDYIILTQRGSIIVNLTKGIVGNMPIPLPPIDEQKHIVSFIRNATEPIDSAISRCEQMIELLTERKQILINDVVTGKIKIL